MTSLKSIAIQGVAIQMSGKIPLDKILPANTDPQIRVGTHESVFRTYRTSTIEHVLDRDYVYQNSNTQNLFHNINICTRVSKACDPITHSSFVVVFVLLDLYRITPS